jgi:hypothetical protein
MAAVCLSELILVHYGLLKFNIAYLPTFFTFKQITVGLRDLHALRVSLYPCIPLINSERLNRSV